MDDRHLDTDHVGFEPRHDACEKKASEGETVSIALNESERTAAERIFAVSLTESELVLIQGALVRFEGLQLQWSREANDKGRHREAKARGETSKKILALCDRLEKEAV